MAGNGGLVKPGNVVQAPHADEAAAAIRVHELRHP
jgi:hypothetical protein